MNIKDKQVVYLTIIISLIGILFIILVISSFQAVNKIAVQTSDKIKEVCFKQHCYSVELAETPAERIKGLMFRKELDENTGMLFIFDKPGNYSFWMKNTLIKLDIIWINENMEIVYIKENVIPCLSENCEVYTPDKKALYVLEVNAGAVKQEEIKIWDKARFIN